MKYLVWSFLTFTMAISGFSQNTVCGTDYFLEKEFEKDPSFQNVAEQNWMLSDGPSTQAEGARAVKIIPVVFHVLHDNGIGNISYAQILSAMDMINEDFRRTNADTLLTRAVFAPFAADSEVEFRLAQIDPDGNCTDGVVRIDNPNASYDAGNNVKSISNWPSNQYFNIWVVNNIESSGVNGIILGYAQFPGTGSWTNYGIVIRNDRVGRTGTAGSGDRTLTHEIGHCLNLMHTFQSGCGSSCQSSGDRVCDTPPVDFSTQACNKSFNQCSNDASGSSVYNTDVVDQIENYMSYNDCQNMYSIGQKVRIQNALNNFNTLVQLTSASNLTNTGVLNTNPGICKAEFEVNSNVICVGQNLSFSDLSFFNPKTYTWKFEGGNPSISNMKDPIVSYNTPGQYKVELTVKDSNNQTATTVRNNYITVLKSNGNTAPFIESFENATSLSELNWFTDFYPPSFGWVLANNGGSTGQSAIKATAYNNSGKISVISEAYDASNLTDAVITFKHAYAPRPNESNNYLRVYVSGDCGLTWKIRYVTGGLNMATRAEMSGAYTNPSSTEWKLDSFSVSTISLTENTRLKFEYNSNDGNNIFVDDIRITGTNREDIILRSPQNNASNVSVNQLLNWNATSAVDYYTVEMDTDTNFSSSNYVTQQLSYISTSSNDVDTEFMMNNLTDGITYYWKVTSTLNGVDTAFSEIWNFKVDSTALSVIDVQNTHLSMSIYPNPASENVNLDVDLNTASPVTILMYDITGNLVKNIFNGTLTNGKSHFNIRRDGLSQGVYLIQVISENGINTARVVLE